MFRRIWPIAFTALLITASSAHAKIIGQFNSGLWTGAILSNDETRKFSMCAIKARYKNGINLSFLIRRDGNMAIALNHKDWRIESANLGKISMFIDGDGVGDFDIKRAGKSQIVAQLGDGDWIYEKFRKGRQLRIVAPKETFNLNLSGTAAALKKTFDCVLQQLASERKTPNPFAAKAKPKNTQNPFEKFDRSRSAESRVARSYQTPPPRKPKSSRRDGGSPEAWQLFIKLAVGENARLIPVDKQFRKLGVEQAWEANGVRGFVGLWNADGDIDTMTNLIMGALGNGCENYATGAQSTEWIDDAEVKTAFGKCQVNQEIRYIATTALRSPKAFTIITHVGNESDLAEVNAINDRVVGFYRFMSKKAKK